ncbi:N-6 DNA methylase [Tenacibaculum maritimum]|uniref:N-6 DNA methylase n=1 Tax=Tenacibaculum maritimum TaxID=107401 RepID=UPI0012E67D7B|nr:N-6 DNA methylase [Tenacibaculum maritimum]CAA0224560.1 N-6 DNA methylase [Tenacibaculum maritimum]
MEVQIDNKKNKIFAPLKDKWLVNTPEERVRQEYICRLVNHYGFQLNQMEQEVTVSNSQRGQGRAQADILIWKSAKDKTEENSPIIVVECKAENITVREEDYFQGMNYASWAGADFFVTSNLKETRIFKVVKGKIPKRLDEIVDIPDSKIVGNQKKIEALLKQTKAFTRDEFSKVLSQCHNIIRNNDKLSPEAAFDEISKVLFIKIRYERDNSEAQIFSKERFQTNTKNYIRHNKELGIIDAKDYYQLLFERTKQDFKDDDLFAENEILRIRENSFEAIVEKLEIYNLSTTSDDVKGIAFEQFLGRTFRGELGQFFTPRTVVDFMVDVLDPQEGEIICDPCCGSGGFLIKAFEFVRAKIENEIQAEKEKIKAKYFDDAFDKLSEKKKAEVEITVNDLFNKLNQELDINNEKSRLRVLSYDCIFGTDANPRMSRTAKMNMIMHGDGHGGVHHNDGLLNVNGIFENRFDVILTNPPFGARVEKSLKITEADKYTDEARIKKYKERYGNHYTKALKQINNNIGKSLLSLYDTGKMSTLTEVLFIERCLNLLKPGGRMGIVLPEGVLNNSNLQKIREYVESKAKIVLITSIPQDVFIASGATVKPSLLFFKKFTEEEAKGYNKIALNAKAEIEEKYASQLAPINSQLGLRGKEAPSAEEKKQLRKDLKVINEKIVNEIKAQIKTEFDYQIPIAEVEKAGISTTGAKIENELEPLAKEFTSYRLENKLWGEKIDTVDYQILEDGSLYRVPIINNVAKEPEIFYGK